VRWQTVSWLTVRWLPVRWLTVRWQTVRWQTVKWLTFAVPSLVLSAVLPRGLEADEASELQRSFAHPPEGYGMVPLYWWSGEPLSVERIARHLDRLKDMGFTGVQANFVPFLEGEFQERSSPKPFTEGWWRIWEGVVRQCKARGMTLGIDDYGFHEQIWDLAHHPELQGWHLQPARRSAAGGENVVLDVPAQAKALSVRA
jgi:hypothetical protein